MVKKIVNIDQIDYEVDDGWTIFTSKNQIIDMSMKIPNSEIIKIAKRIQARDD